jgi:hypothetical protein
MAEEKKETQYALVEVTTQTGLAIQSPEGKVLNTEQAIVEILNLLKLLNSKI